jgi:hypothetical protein
LGNIVSGVLIAAGLLSLPAIPDAIAKWPPMFAQAVEAIRWLQDRLPLSGDVGRWALVIAGVLLLLIVNWRSRGAAAVSPQHGHKPVEPAPWAGQISSETGGAYDIAEPILPPIVTAEAEAATGTGQAFESTIKISDAIEAQITRGPANPGVNEINWRTQGQMERHIHIAFRPRALRFFEPTDQIVREADLPSIVPIGRGHVVVRRFFDQGVMVDEIGTVGDVVRAEPYPAGA